MEFAELTDRVRVVRARFAEFEHRRYGRSWTPEEILLGLVGDVGDLAKLVQAKAGIRDTTDLEAKLGHELADCLWAILILADCYDVDLETAFGSTMDEIGRWLDASDPGGTGAVSSV